MSFPSHPVILTIAGSDSGGGAGIQADIKTITALGGFAASVITALTAQNAAEVRGIHEAPAPFVALQLQTVRDGFPVKAAKTGMLSSGPIIEALAKNLFQRDFPLVVDPVCVSQSGHRLLREDAIEALIRKIIPQADLLTPNRPEAELLTGMSIHAEKDVEKAATALINMGARAVLIKGGHFDTAEHHGISGDTNRMTDWLALPGHPLIPLAHPRVHTHNNHGTGCTLSAAIATFLGMGNTLPDAVAKAQIYLTRALETSFAPGIGAGPPNFMGGRGE